MMFGGDLDQELLLKLNALAGTHSGLYELATNSLFRGFPIFVSLAALWFTDECGKRRSRMLAGLLGVCLATVLSVWFQFHVAVHTRPLLDPALHLNTVDVPWSWDRKSSFPSDTATLFFGLATVVFLESRLVGLICFLWAIVVVAMSRVAFGFHYPSDIIGSLILGSGFVFLFNKLPYPRVAFERMLFAFSGRMYLVHALLFVFLAEASNLFLSLEQLGKDFVRLVQ
jgi:membrane-associated phospholipid phosphatase